MSEHDDCPRCPLCGEHRHGGSCIVPDDGPVPGGPPMREGNNPRTGIAYNE